jgi:hypothetical protein
MENTMTEILSILMAYPKKDVEAAIEQYLAGIVNSADGWEIWPQDNIPPQPYEWRRVGSVVQYRLPTKRVSRKRAKNQPVTRSRIGMVCPDCGAQAFPQALCPKSKQAKAGLKTFWVCGNDPEHSISFTED